MSISTESGFSPEQEAALAAAKSAYEEKTRSFLQLVSGRSKADDRRVAFEVWHSSALEFFNLHDRAVAADSLSKADQAAPWYTYRAETAINLLDTILNHYAAVQTRAVELKQEPRALRPSLTAFASLQRIVQQTHPDIAAELRVRFVDASLPTHGFDNPQKRTPAADGGRFPLWERILGWLATISILLICGWLVVRNQPFADPNLVVIVRTALSICTAVLASVLPGFLHVRMGATGITIRAGGALAVFVITFFGTPTVLPLKVETKSEGKVEAVDVGFLDYDADARAPRLDLKFANRRERAAFLKRVNIDVRGVWKLPGWPNGVGVVVPPSHNYVVKLRPDGAPYRTTAPLAQGLKPDEFDRFTVQFAEESWAASRTIYLIDAEVIDDRDEVVCRKPDLMFVVTQQGVAFPNTAAVREILRGQESLGVKTSLTDLKAALASARDMILSAASVQATRSNSLQRLVNTAKVTDIDWSH